MIDRVVSFTGDGLKKIYNVRVKIGTLAQDVITFLGGYQAYEEMLLVAGGPLMGTAFPTDEIAISPEINCILALPHELSKLNRGIYVVKAKNTDGTVQTIKIVK